MPKFSDLIDSRFAADNAPMSQAEYEEAYQEAFGVMPALPQDPATVDFLRNAREMNNPDNQAMEDLSVGIVGDPYSWIDNATHNPSSNQKAWQPMDERPEVERVRMTKRRDLLFRALHEPGLSHTERQELTDKALDGLTLQEKHTLREDYRRLHAELNTAIDSLSFALESNNIQGVCAVLNSKTKEELAQLQLLFEQRENITLEEAINAASFYNDDPNIDQKYKDIALYLLENGFNAEDRCKKMNEILQSLYNENDPEYKNWAERRVDDITSSANDAYDWILCRSEETSQRTEQRGVSFNLSLLTAGLSSEQLHELNDNLDGNLGLKERLRSVDASLCTSAVFTSITPNNPQDRITTPEEAKEQAIVFVTTIARSNNPDMLLKDLEQHFSAYNPEEMRLLRHAVHELLTEGQVVNDDEITYERPTLLNGLTDRNLIEAIKAIEATSLTELLKEKCNHAAQVSEVLEGFNANKMAREVIEGIMGLPADQLNAATIQAFLIDKYPHLREDQLQEIGDAFERRINEPNKYESDVVRDLRRALISASANTSSQILPWDNPLRDYNSDSYHADPADNDIFTNVNLFYVATQYSDSDRTALNRRILERRDNPNAYPDENLPTHPIPSPEEILDALEPGEIAAMAGLLAAYRDEATLTRFKDLAGEKRYESVMGRVETGYDANTQARALIDYALNTQSSPPEIPKEELREHELFRAALVEELKELKHADLERFGEFIRENDPEPRIEQDDSNPPQNSAVAQSISELLRAQDARFYEVLRDKERTAGFALAHYAVKQLCTTGETNAFTYFLTNSKWNKNVCHATFLETARAELLSLRIEDLSQISDEALDKIAAVEVSGVRIQVLSAEELAFLKSAKELGHNFYKDASGALQGLQRGDLESFKYHIQNIRSLPLRSEGREAFSASVLMALENFRGELKGEFNTEQLGEINQYLKAFLDNTDRETLTESLRLQYNPYEAIAAVREGLLSSDTVNPNISAKLIEELSDKPARIALVRRLAPALLEASNQDELVRLSVIISTEEAEQIKLRDLTIALFDLTNREDLLIAAALNYNPNPTADRLAEAIATNNVSEVAQIVGEMHQLAPPLRRLLVVACRKELLGMSHEQMRGIGLSLEEPSPKFHGSLTLSDDLRSPRDIEQLSYLMSNFLGNDTHTFIKGLEYGINPWLNAEEIIDQLNDPDASHPIMALARISMPTDPDAIIKLNLCKDILTQNQAAYRLSDDALVKLHELLSDPDQNDQIYTRSLRLAFNLDSAASAQLRSAISLGFNPWLREEAILEAVKSQDIEKLSAIFTEMRQGGPLFEERFALLNATCRDTLPEMLSQFENFSDETLLEIREFLSSNPETAADFNTFFKLDAPEQAAYQTMIRLAFNPFMRQEALKEAFVAGEIQAISTLVSSLSENVTPAEAQERLALLRGITSDKDIASYRDAVQRYPDTDLGAIALLKAKSESLEARAISALLALKEDGDLNTAITSGFNPWLAKDKLEVLVRSGDTEALSDFVNTVFMSPAPQGSVAELFDDRALLFATLCSEEPAYLDGIESNFKNYSNPRLSELREVLFPATDNVNTAAFRTILRLEEESTLKQAIQLGVNPWSTAEEIEEALTEPRLSLLSIHLEVLDSPDKIELVRRELDTDARDKLIYFSSADLAALNQIRLQQPERFERFVSLLSLDEAPDLEKMIELEFNPERSTDILALAMQEGHISELPKLIEDLVSDPEPKIREQRLDLLRHCQIENIAEIVTNLNSADLEKLHELLYKDEENADAGALLRQLLDLRSSQEALALDGSEETLAKNAIILNYHPEQEVQEYIGRALRMPAMAEQLVDAALLRAGARDDRAISTEMLRSTAYQALTALTIEDLKNLNHRLNTDEKLDAFLKTMEEIYPPEALPLLANSIRTGWNSFADTLKIQEIVANGENPLKFIYENIYSEDNPTLTMYMINELEKCWPLLAPEQKFTEVLSSATQGIADRKWLAELLYGDNTILDSENSHLVTIGVDSLLNHPPQENGAFIELQAEVARFVYGTQAFEALEGSKADDPERLADLSLADQNICLDSAIVLAQFAQHETLNLNQQRQISRLLLSLEAKRPELMITIEQTFRMLYSPDLDGSLTPELKLQYVKMQENFTAHLDRFRPKADS